MAACLEAGFSSRLGQEAPRITSALKLNDRRSILLLFLNASQLAQKRVQSR